MASTPLRGQWRQAVPCFWARRLQTAPFLGAMVSASWHATKIAGRLHLMFAPRFGCSMTPDRTFFGREGVFFLRRDGECGGGPTLRGRHGFKRTGATTRLRDGIKRENHYLLNVWSSLFRETNSPPWCGNDILSGATTATAWPLLWKP